MAYSHRELCKLACYWLLDQPRIDLACWDMALGGGFVDAIGITSRPGLISPKILAIEVKRTRSDLLADLRKRKMLKYEPHATHCYLACTRESLLLKPRQRYKTALEDMHSKGLPDHWGLILLPTKRFFHPRLIRPPSGTRMARPEEIQRLTRHMARSFCNRVLAGSIKEDKKK